MENPFEQSESRDSSSKQLWRFGLNTIKTEIILYDLKQSLYWQSAIEAGIMMSAFIALLTSHSLLFFMHILHIVRPFFGYKIIIRLPKTHLILEQISESPAVAQQEAANQIISQFKAASMFYSQYLVISGISAVLDLLALLYNLSNTGSNTNTYIFYVNIAWVFLGFDFYVLLWSRSIDFGFPKSVSDTSREIVNNTIRDTNVMINGVINTVIKK